MAEGMQRPSSPLNPTMSVFCVDIVTTKHRFDTADNLIGRLLFAVALTLFRKNRGALFSNVTSCFATTDSKVLILADELSFSAHIENFRLRRIPAMPLFQFSRSNTGRMPSYQDLSFLFLVPIECYWVCERAISMKHWTFFAAQSAKDFTPANISTSLTPTTDPQSPSPTLSRVQTQTSLQPKNQPQATLGLAVKAEAKLFEKLS